jgi:hypothetical protein
VKTIDKKFQCAVPSRQCINVNLKSIFQQEARAKQLRSSSARSCQRLWGADAAAATSDQEILRQAIFPSPDHERPKEDGLAGQKAVPKSGFRD